MLCFEQGQMSKAVDLFEDSAHELRAMGLPKLSAQARLNRASALTMLGRHAEALPLLSDGRTVLGEHNSRRGDRAAGLFLGRLHLNSGDLVGAQAALEDTLQATRDDSPRWTGHCRLWLGIVAHEHGDLDAADRHLGRATALANEHGLKRLGMIAQVFNALLAIEGGTAYAPVQIQMPWHCELADGLSQIVAAREAAVTQPGALAAVASIALLTRSLEARAALRIAHRFTPKTA